MLKEKKSLIGGIMVVSLLTLVATPVFAKSISLKEAGVALWIFIIIGAVIVLLQLIPAMILFFSFVGTVTGLTLKKKPLEGVRDEEKIVVPRYEPAPVKK
jgi:hypothetical protein